MTKVIARVHPVHLMNADWVPVATNPQTKPINLGCESAENWQLPPTSTIATVIITQPVQQANTHFAVPWKVEGWVDLGTAERCAAHAKGCISQWPSRKTQPSAVWFKPGSSHIVIGHANHYTTATTATYLVICKFHGNHPVMYYIVRKYNVNKQTGLNYIRKYWSKMSWDGA